ncbi:hypothetical protein CDAR_74881 [Caerostris darwini]|uniref:Uncharacterized protein n=1 Tax=Caerostris darwini TaxID=1538125 RepID=A0AAV4P0I6_9ARAC|nr:hypothetical protein CDAR_74881 [Caerostris darwini]
MCLRTIIFQFKVNSSHKTASVGTYRFRYNNQSSHHAFSSTLLAKDRFLKHENYLHIKAILLTQYLTFHLEDHNRNFASSVVWDAVTSRVNGSQRGLSVGKSRRLDKDLKHHPPQSRLSDLPT